MSFLMASCAEGLAPQARNIDIPPPVKATPRSAGVNEKPDSVMYLPLGRDVLVPEAMGVDPLPQDVVGPFELRGETLGGALQLVLADVDIPIAFQTDQGLSRTVTVTNLKGKLSDVVDQICSLSGLYCSYEGGALVVKDKQTFAVTVPPLGDQDNREAFLTSVSNAIKAVTGSTPVVDTNNRTIVYEANSRTAREVNQYLQRMRASTSLIVYETYIWEVSLNAGNSTGINWDLLDNAEKFKIGLSMAGSVSADVGTPISIGLPTKGEVNFTTGDVLKFISSYGAVKTISQPQLTMLSGAKAKMRVADKENYVSKITRTVTGDQVTVATETDSVESGFTLNIGSSWDNATVYGDFDILLQEVKQIQTFDDNPEAIVQLPQTTEREVQTQVRIRPGDSLLIAGLVREVDNLTKEGLGLEQPIIPNSRTAQTSNIELVFLLKPRVIVFTDGPARYDRAPVDADKPAQPVELRRGNNYTQIPAQEDEPTVKEDKTKEKSNADKADQKGKESADKQEGTRAPAPGPVMSQALAPKSDVVNNLFAEPPATTAKPSAGNKVVKAVPEKAKSKSKAKSKAKTKAKAKSVAVDEKKTEGASVPTVVAPELEPAPVMPDPVSLVPDQAPSAAAPVVMPPKDEAAEKVPENAGDLAEKLLQSGATSAPGADVKADPLPLLSPPTNPILPTEKTP